MEPSRRWMPSSVCFVAALVLILPLIAASLMTYAQEGKAKADRLVLGPINPCRNDAWTWVSSAETGQFSPWLAKSWELAPEGKSWRLQLQEGVSYHYGDGEFTSNNVIRAHVLWGDAKDPVRKTPTTDYCNGIGAVDRANALGDHEIGMRCQAPRLAVLLGDSEAVHNHPAVPLFHRSDTRPEYRQDLGLARLEWLYRVWLADFSLFGGVTV